MARLHIAILDEELPFPLTSGKRIRTFNLVTRLARQHRITFVAHRNSDAAEFRAAVDALTIHNVTILPVDYRVPEKSGLAFYGRLAKNLLSPLPFSVATHASRAMGRAIDELLRNDAPDLWHCEWTPYAEAMRGRSLSWVVMAHNVESLIWRRFAETERGLKSWFLRGQWRKFERFESWAYAKATRAIAVSDEDAALMRERFGAKDPAVVENGVDLEFFVPNPTITRDPKRTLFLGSLDWRPNQDGVRQLVDEIFPTVRAAEPWATLAIVGRKPPEWISAFARRPGVEVHADVPDVRPFLHTAGQLAVPLRIGGGSRLKILEALATELPVVTTRVGVEGLRLRDGEHCIVADAPNDFAQAIVDGMREPERVRTAARRGRERVVAEYGWEALATKMDAVWRGAVRE